MTRNLNEPQEPVVETAVVQPPVQTEPIAPPDETPAPAVSEALAAEGIPSRFACFVTGTDTEIGKTLVSAAILHKLVEAGQRACGMKPIAAGAELIDGELHNEDADMLAAAGNVHLPQNITTPFLLREPCAPHVAAALEGVTIDPVPIIAAYASADLAAQLNLPVILVVGMRLGCISHALLTVEAIVARGLVLAGWVANSADPDMRFFDENVEALARRIPAPLLGVVPRLEQATAANAARFIDLAGLPGWPSARTSAPQ